MRTGVIPFVFGVLTLLGTSGVEAQEYAADANPSLDRILPGIRERHPGKFYDAQGPWRGPDGQYRYRLKWMTPDGRIVWFDADARTGRVLGPDAQAPDPMRERPRFRDAGPPPDQRPQFRDYGPPPDQRPRFRDNGPPPDDGRNWGRGNRWPGAGRPPRGPRRGRGF